MTEVAGRPMTPPAPGRRTRSPAPVGAPWLAALVVWGGWAAATLVAGVWLMVGGRRVPFADDWFVVPVIAGEWPLTFGWLWSQYGEHRVLVPRLAATQLVALSGGDFRALIAFNLVLLSATAAACVVVLRRVRGRIRLADAFFPLVLLCLTISGLNWGMNAQFVVTAAAATGVLLVIVRYGLAVPAAPLWLSLGLLLVLLGDGGTGLAMLPGLCVWLGLASLALRETRPVHGGLLLGATALLVAGIGAYFIGYEQQGRSLARSVSAFLVALGHVASVPGGDRMTDLWPWSGLVAVAVIAATVTVLVRALRRSGGEERRTGLALVLFGAAVTTLMVAIAWGRGGNEWGRGLEHHYGALLIPLACWIYVIWDRYGGSARSWATATLCAAALVAYWYGLWDARTIGPAIARDTAAFERDACAGVPTGELLARHMQVLAHVDNEEWRQHVAGGIDVLRRHRFGPFDC